METNTYKVFTMYQDLRFFLSFFYCMLPKMKMLMELLFSLFYS